MWQMQHGLYLEPGELAVLASLARQVVPQGAPTHPRDLMLAALADVLDQVVDGAGVVVLPAPPEVVRQSARAYVHTATVRPMAMNGADFVDPERGPDGQVARTAFLGGNRQDW